MQHDIISDALSTVRNAECVGKTLCTVPNSKLVKAILESLQKAGYIGQIKASGRVIRVQLLGKINALYAVRPRFSVARDDFQKFERRYLPAHDVGVIIVSTSQGIMMHKEAIEKRIGGRLLAYVY